VNGGVINARVSFGQKRRKKAPGGGPGGERVEGWKVGKVSGFWFQVEKKRIRDTGYRILFLPLSV
jgi:hypothetical protein